MRKLIVAATIAAAVVMATGCTGGTSESSATSSASKTTSTTPTPTPSPTPTQMTVQQAGEYYLQIVAPSNAALDELKKAAAATPPNLDNIKAKAAAKRDADWQFAKNMQSARWPSEVGTGPQDLANLVISQNGIYSSMSIAQSLDQFESTWDTMPGDGGNIANQLRMKLNLPPA